MRESAAALEQKEWLMKKKITALVKEHRALIARAEKREYWSEVDYLEGLVDAYEIVLQMMEKEK